FNLRGHWAQAQTPDVLYFVKDGTFVPGSTNQTNAPATAVFRAIVTYLQPPTETTSLADVTVTWPAAVDPTTGTPAGKVETFAAINRRAGNYLESRRTEGGVKPSHSRNY